MVSILNFCNFVVILKQFQNTPSQLQLINKKKKKKNSIDPHLYDLFFDQVNGIIGDALFGLLQLTDGVGPYSPQQVLGLVTELLCQFHQILPVFSRHPARQIYG